MAEWIVISLGGSMIVPKTGIDTEFLKSFREIILRLLAEGKHVMLITGGGKTCRDYNAAAERLSSVTKEELDWLGIRVTQLNAHLVKLVFKEAQPHMVGDPEHDALPDVPLLIGAGWLPGWSSDVDAVTFAKRLGARRLINISNVAHVYSEDPKVNPAATKFDEMSWAQMRSIVGDEWRPGLNTPFDPVAARMCQELGLEVDIVAGDDIPNIERALRGERFVGTRIHD